MNKQKIEGQLGAPSCGILLGLDSVVPASGLTITYSDGVARVKARNAIGYTEYAIGGTTYLCTASKDTYFYVNGATGAIAAVAVALGAAKPTLDTIGEFSEFLWKAVSGATDVTSFVDLRRQAAAKVIPITVPVSFEATEVGVTIIRPGFAGRVLALETIVANALAGTDAGTTKVGISKFRATSVDVTNAATSHAASAAIADRDIQVATGVNYFGAFDDLHITTAKSTAGGYAVATVWCEEV